MIKFIKAKNYKGITEDILLNELRQINILCGKNSSGKTSLVEALTNKDKRALGKELTQDVKAWMEKLFAPYADKYSSPDPRMVKRWFSKNIQDIIDQEVVWYTDQVADIKENFEKKQNENRFGIDVNYDKILKELFKNTIENYKPVIIPPKRTVEDEVELDFSGSMNANGLGITNAIFYLKNQDLNSEEHKMYEKIYEAFTEITDCNFNVIPNSSNKLTLFYRHKKSKGQWIRSDSSGLGLSDVLVMISLILANNYTLYCIEEPESHLHPEMQKKFLKFIKKQTSKQFVFSTHSSVFLDTNIVDKIYFVEYDGKVKVSDQTSKSSILHNLGYSVADNFVSDLIIFTEGPTDQPIIEKILEWLEIDDKYNIKYWPLGGDNMASLDMSVFAEQKNVFALIDNDPASSVIRTRFKTMCDENNIVCHRLERYAIENYFSIEAIRKVIPDILQESALDPALKVDTQLFGEAGKSIKSSNRKIIDNMSLEDFQETDLLKFCEEIKHFLEESGAEDSIE